MPKYWTIVVGLLFIVFSFYFTEESALVYWFVKSNFLVFVLRGLWRVAASSQRRKPTAARGNYPLLLSSTAPTGNPNVPRTFPGNEYGSLHFGDYFELARAWAPLDLMEKVLWGLKGVLVGVDQCLRWISQIAFNKLPKSSFISVSCIHISFGAFLVWLWHFVFVVYVLCALHGWA